MVGPEWTIRAARATDARRLVDLFARVFGKTISEAHWVWKLGQHASPVANVWIALDGERVVFQYAGVPVRFHVCGVERLGMVVVDVMTDPDYRRRGLLTQGGRHAHDRWRDAGVTFVIGLPNERWGSRTTALGWTPAFRLQWLARVVRPTQVLARRLGLPVLARVGAWDALWNRSWKAVPTRGADLQITEVQRADARFDVLWQAAATKRDVSVVRDSAWINWRYIAAPELDYRVSLAERKGEPVGYVVHRIETECGRTIGSIAELVACDDATSRRLIRAAVDVLRVNGAEVIRTLAVPATTSHDAFRHAGFVGRASFGVEIVPLDRDVPLELLCDPRRWHIAGGDFDVI